MGTCCSAASTTAATSEGGLSTHTHGSERGRKNGGGFFGAVVSSVVNRKGSGKIITVSSTSSLEDDEDEDDDDDDDSPLTKHSESVMMSIVSTACGDHASSCSSTPSNQIVSPPGSVLLGPHEDQPAVNLAFHPLEPPPAREGSSSSLLSSSGSLGRITLPRSHFSHGRPSPRPQHLQSLLAPLASTSRSNVTRSNSIAATERDASEADTVVSGATSRGISLMKLWADEWGPRQSSDIVVKSSLDFDDDNNSATSSDPIDDDGTTTDEIAALASSLTTRNPRTSIRHQPFFLPTSGSPTSVDLAGTATTSINSVPRVTQGATMGWLFTASGGSDGRKMSLSVNVHSMAVSAGGVSAAPTPRNAVDAILSSTFDGTLSPTARSLDGTTRPKFVSVEVNEEKGEAIISVKPAARAGSRSSIAHETTPSNGPTNPFATIMSLDECTDVDGGATTVADTESTIVPQAPVQFVTELIRGLDADGNKVVNNYVVLGELGTGSYGKVKLAIDMVTQQTVAIKVLNRTRLKKIGAHDSIHREISVMESMRHPNIVRLLSVIDDPSAEKMYLVMEYLPCGTLNEDIERASMDDFDILTFRRRFLDVLHGLQYLHNHNVVHMDIKPENILVGEDGTCKLADFGVSTILQANFERDEDVLESMKGTPMFHAPEVVQGVPFHGKATDVWALGVTMYMCVYGKSPFRSGNLMELQESIATDRIHVKTLPDVPGILVDVLKSMLLREPSMRATVPQLLGHPFFARGQIPSLEWAVRAWKMSRAHAALSGSSVEVESASSVTSPTTVHSRSKGSMQGSMHNNSVLSSGSVAAVTAAAGVTSPNSNNSSSNIICGSGGLLTSSLASDAANTNPPKTVSLEAVPMFVLKDNTDRTRRRTVGTDVLMASFADSEPDGAKVAVTTDDECSPTSNTTDNNNNNNRRTSNSSKKRSSKH
eukprot:PhM_4_TR13977/c4_g7_i3/m.15593/K07359/CAMKK2; calcium/calmodulin-dependent protein kinase kinase 2